MESNSDVEIFKRLDHLYRTWPSDGWIGAAAVIAAHAQQAYAVEDELAARHAVSGKHGPEHPYYRGQCCCRKTRVVQPK